MSIDMQAYAFIISPISSFNDFDDLEDAFLEELNAGKIERPHRLRGSSWGDDGECAAYFFSLPAAVDGLDACYAGMGRAAENGWSLDDDTYQDLVKLPADWYEALEAAHEQAVVA